MEVFQPSRPLIVVLRAENRLVGLAPFLLYRSGTNQVLGLMGGGVSDYLDVLIAPQFEREACSRFWELINQTAEWTQLSFTDLHPNSPLLHARNLPVEPHEFCPILQLPGCGQELKATVPAVQLRNLRNARWRLERAGGGIVEVATAETLDNILHSMFELHGTRWSSAGETGVLCDERIRRFHCLAAPKLLSTGCLRLYALKHREQVIATLYGLFEANLVYCYLQGFDPHFSFVSPGTQVLGALLEDAVLERKGSADFLRGRESYKYRWGAVDQPTYRISAPRAQINRMILSERAA
jgi:CelD/BcsL family acetyltransferase involved in cellulose biosynthesis